MGNLVALLAHCGRGQEAILGDESHIFHYEVGSSSALGGIVLHTVRTEPDGTLPLGEIERAIRSEESNYHYFHYAPAGAICLENTHNRCGGRIVPPEYFAQVADLAARHRLPVHVDGARLFNAAVASGRPVTDWTRHVTSVQVCLSKGLGAPAGSLVFGSRDFVRRARHARKALGGGMRQAGVLAAPGIVALTEMVGRLSEDHANARLLAEGLAVIPGVSIDPAEVQTNIVVFKLADAARAEALQAAARASGLLLSNFGGGRLRAVTRYGVTADDCRSAVKVIERLMAA